MIGALTRPQAEALSTCAGFVRGVLGLESYPWADDVFHDLDGRGARVAVKSANGAGKTSRLAAPAALWHASVFPRSLTICTSGVYRQVAQQLFPALHSHRHKFGGWEFLENEVRTPHGSFIHGFSTDEPGKFEGWHAENLLMILDEAKSLPDKIFEAVERCQPTRLLLLSSPGGCQGEFYQAFNGRRAFYKCHSVAAADCKHIDPKWIEQQIEKYGESHPLVRSMIFAEFMDGGEDGAVIPLSFIERCIADPPKFEGDGSVHAFCDFAAGGDENVLAVRRGNRVEIVKAWRDKDTMRATGEFIRLYKAQGLSPQQIGGDNGGLGRVIIDRLRENGWSIRRINNGGRARKDRAYQNLSAEWWYEGRSKIEQQQVILPKDQTLIGQLSSRLGGPNSAGKLQLETKDQMRARGLPSPDRADAVIGAMNIGAYTYKPHLFFTGGQSISRYSAGLRGGDDD